MDLKEFFEKYNKIALAFSGGVDSSYLLYKAKSLGVDIKAYYVKTEFQPEFEYEDALKMIKNLGVKYEILHLSPLDNELVKSNPSNRCYYCKNIIFNSIRDKAKEDGYDIVIDGTNASDDANDRPGMKALQELGVYSPLRLAGLSKVNIRDLSKEAGLFTHNKPAYACLATRVPTGREITKEDLQKIELAENILFDLGFKSFRVRLLDKGAKLEFTKEGLEKVLIKREEILNRLKNIFAYIYIDLETRNEL